MKKIISAILVTITIFSGCTNCVQAQNSLKITQAEQSEDFKKYVELSEEEQKKFETMPETVNIPEYDIQVSNPIKALEMISANSSTNRRFSLVDEIPENVKIKNQLNLGNCWIFSTLASLETNLALANKKNGKIAKEYDFSEKHFDYAMTRNYFNNNEINKYGINRERGGAGNWQMSIAYLTTGRGAVNESVMPYDDKKDKINLSAITNATVATDVQNIKYYPSVTDVTPENISQLKSLMKADLPTNGGISAKVYFPDIGSEYFNNSTGALYCNDSSKIVDHAITIIGWDDDFEISNFNSAHVPTNPGAWIAKNSWGTEMTCTLNEFKQTVYSLAKEQLNQQGINSASQISDDLAKTYIAQLSQFGFRAEGSTVYFPVGDNGYIYISYEDKKVYQNLMGIVDATETKDYDNVYYYDEVGWSNVLSTEESQIYLANIFNTENSGREQIKKVGISTVDATTCKVYVNPNGKSIKKSDLQQVELDKGNSVEIAPGYHTLNFKNPIAINSSEFAIVIELTAKDTDDLHVVGEAPVDNINYEYVNVESDKCYIASSNEFESGEWTDLSKLSNEKITLKNMDSTIKAYTTVVDNTDEPNLQKIEVTTQPFNIKYEEGQDFNKAGLVVTAFYDNNTSKTINDYTITDGTNLKKGQNKVNISYNGKTAYVNITVSEKSDNENYIEPDEEEENDLPENSNLSNLKGSVIDINIYDDILKIKIDNFYPNANNEKVEYSFYLSSTTSIPSEKFIEMEDATIKDNSLIFTIDGEQIPNMDELNKADKLYLFIKEKATKGGNYSEVVSNAILLELNEEATINDKPIDEFLDEFETDLGIKTAYSSQLDETVAKEPIPQTGMNSITIFIFIALAVGILGFIKFKKLKK